MPGSDDLERVWRAKVLEELVDIADNTVSGGTGLTDAELRASPVPVTGPITNAQLRASPLPLPTGAATEATLGGVANQATLALIKAKTDNIDVALSTRAVTGLTDAQLRAAPVPVSGTVTTSGLTDAQLRASPVPVSGPLTDTQLRAAPVSISGTVATGGLTDTQLRAAAVAVADDYANAPEVLADQAGAGAVLTFTFAATVVLVLVESSSGTPLVPGGIVSRITFAAQIPSTVLGVRCVDEKTYLPCPPSTVVKVFAPVGATVNMIGWRR